MIPHKNKFRCTFRTIGTDRLEISTSFQIQQENSRPEDWNLFLEIFIDKVQSAISTIDSIKKQSFRNGHSSRSGKKFVNGEFSKDPSEQTRSDEHPISSEQPNTQSFDNLTSKTLGTPIISYEDRFLQKVMTVLEHNRSDFDFTTLEFSRQVCMSRSQLHRRLKCITGYTSSGIIRMYRLEYAKGLIEKRFGNMAQIAFECGFSNPSYFAECFKREYGLLPSEYSKQRA